MDRKTHSETDGETDSSVSTTGELKGFRKGSWYPQHVENIDSYRNFRMKLESWGRGEILIF